MGKGEGADLMIEGGRGCRMAFHRNNKKAMRRENAGCWESHVMNKMFRRERLAGGPG